MGYRDWIRLRVWIMVMVRARVNVCVGLGLGSGLRKGKLEPPSHPFPSLSHLINHYPNLTLIYTLSLTLSKLGKG